MMQKLSFTNLGLLPHGVHECTFAEVENLLVFNDDRTHLWSQLRRCIQYMLSKEINKGLMLIDGSFVTDKETPGDIDIVLDITTQGEDFQKNALHFCFSQHDYIKQYYNIDLYPYLPSTSDFRTFFQYVGAKTAIMKSLTATDKKGILQVNNWVTSQSSVTL